MFFGDALSLQFEHAGFSRLNKGGGKLFHPSPMSNSSQFPLFSGSKMTTAQVGIIDRLFPEKCGCSASNWLKSLKCQPTKQISNIPFLFVLCLPWAVKGSPYNEEKPTNEHHHSCLKLLYWNALSSAVKSPSLSQPIYMDFLCLAHFDLLRDEAYFIYFEFLCFKEAYDYNPRCFIWHGSVHVMINQV